MPISLDSGFASVDEENDMLLIDNTKGFSLHGLHDICSPKTLATFSTGRARNAKPKHVVFGEFCQIVVAGSDQGNVFIFDLKGGDPIDILKHNSNGLVQSVTVG